MKVNKILAIALAFASVQFAADACTSLIATAGASADSSTMITYAADSHVLYGSLYFKQGGDHAPGTMRPVVDWDSGKLLGEIPEAPHTYTRVGNMNECGVTIAESTWGGHEELEGSGLIDYGSLIYIALERAATAREALDTMIWLVDNYGYASEGESFSIADPNEVWVLELIGKGKADPGAVWVARRVPDGYISGHANHSRIHKFPKNDPETLYSPDVIDFARAHGYYDGDDDDFSFSRTYATYDSGSLRGCDARVWSYFNRFTSPEEASQWIPWILRGEGDPMPLWVKPSRQLTADDMKWMMRDHFEDTPLDMTKDVGAGPFEVPYRWRPLTFEVDGVEYTHERAIATQQTGFSFVSSMNNSRPQPMRGILWFGVDDANTCVYVPVFSSAQAVPHALAEDNGDLYTLSWDAMFWVNNYVANQAYNRYSQMIPDIRRVQSRLEAEMTECAAAAQREVADMDYDAAARLLTDLTDQWATQVTSDYRTLGDYLLVKYLDGNVKKEVDGKFARTPEGVPVQPSWPGYNEQYYRAIVNDAGERLRTVEPAPAR